MVAPTKENIGIRLGANNLCSLCFKVPEFVLPLFSQFLENDSAREAAEMVAQTKRGYWD